MAFKYELGSKAKDKVTSYTGIIIGRTEWLYGCRRYTLQSQEMKDGKPIEAMGFDEEALEIVEATKPHKLKDTGGPQREPSRSSDAKR